MIDNTFTHDGFYGNPTNGDYRGARRFEPAARRTASRRMSTRGGALTSSPAGLEQSNPTCDGQRSPATNNQAFLAESLCDSQYPRGKGFGCQPGDHYPRRTKVVMHPLPRHLATMPNLCAHVPANAWCRAPKQGNSRADVAGGAARRGGGAGLVANSAGTCRCRRVLTSPGRWAP